MLCEKCKKNTATIFFQQIVNGEKNEFHLCEECAAKMHESVSFDTMFNDFIEGFMDMSGIGYSEKLSNKCPSCGMSFDSFRQTGKMGCIDCYSSFKKQLEPLLKNIQGSTVHSGKYPKKAGAELYIKREIENLRTALKKAVENEEFEEAVRLRDKIREMEGGMKNE